MKTKLRTNRSSLMTIIIPLVITVVLIVGAIILTKTKTDDRSKAAYNPTQSCIAACNNKSQVKDKAACALDCPGVIAGTMTCEAFCGQNVKSGINAYTNPNTGVVKSPMSVCKGICNGWVADPCGTTSGVCKETGRFADACTDACNAVKDEEITCDEAFTTASFSGMSAKQLFALKARCKSKFE